MKGNELQLLWAFIAIIIFTFVIPFAVLQHTPTFSGGFTFFLLVSVVTIIYIAIYMAKCWKEMLK
jgi:hypothetical protein